jgi:hypothetical protein
MNKRSTPKKTTSKSGSTTRSTAAKKAPAKRAAPTRSRKTAAVHLDGDARRAVIERLAYFRAEQRGFAQGGELDDWLEAEREVARMLD